MRPIRSATATAVAMAVAVALLPGAAPAGAAAPHASPQAAGHVPGVQLPLHTKEQWIVDRQGQRVKLASVNWFGAESAEFVVGGLDKQPLATIAGLIRRGGFNSVRLPWSNELVESNPVVDATYLTANPRLQGKRALQIYDAVVDELGRNGLMVILDNHRSRGDWCCDEAHGDGLWHTPAYPEAAWIADWKFMVARYRDRPHVVAAELRNEIRPDPSQGLTPTWGDGNPNTDWRAAAIRGGNAVLSVNPRLLIIIGGMDYQSNLRGVPDFPVTLSIPHRVAYATHTYPWSHSMDQLTDDAAFAANIATRWSFVQEPGHAYTAPVYVSEWGGCTQPRDDGSICTQDRLLFPYAFIRYAANSDIDFAWWPINGTQSAGYNRVRGGVETWGLLNPQWSAYANPELMAAITAIQKPAPAVAPQAIQVDLGQRTGPVRHGANGALYGMSDDGVPSDNLLEPLKLRTISQKAPAGLQHPNGDAAEVASAFIRTGGEDVYICVQDIYAQWPYENLGLADYLRKLDAITAAIVASPHRRNFVYIPFNEPDAIWYNLRTGDPVRYAAERDRFLADWATVVTKIRTADPGARIAGPNETRYDGRFLPDFLSWAKLHGVLPDVMTWHELSPSFMSGWRSHFDGYRAIESQAGVGPLPININEYGNRRDLSVPGQLVQWISRFEADKVDADQAYWDVAGNLDGNVVQTNQPNGGWWFFKMYADMTGETVAVTPPDPDGVDTLQGMASIDDTKRQAHIVVGGSAGDSDVVISNVPFGRTARVTVSATTWSGYDADEPPPVILRDGDVRVSGDTLTVPLRGMDPMAAYEIVLSPGGNGSFADTTQPWHASYEAELAQIVDATVSTQGTVANANGYATSGTKDVGSINKPTSSVTFTVDVAATGRYKLGILFGNQTGDIAQQVLRVDGGQAILVAYPATLNWQYRARRDVELTLTGGTHQLTLATSDPVLGTAKAEVTLDRVDLQAIVDKGFAYEAERATTTGVHRYEYGRLHQSGPGYVVLQPAARTTFAVYAPSDGYYDLSLRYTAPGRANAELSLGGTVVTGAGLPGTQGDQWRVANRRLFLSAGINRVGVQAARGAVAIDALSTVEATHGSGAIHSMEAESGTLAGAAEVVANEYASGGAYVGSLGNGAGNSLTLTGVHAPRSGQYVLTIRYANNERGAGHQYNANIISRAADISINGAPPARVWFRNTWAWNNFWTLTIPVNLRHGTNTIQLANPSGYAPQLDKIDIAPLHP